MIAMQLNATHGAVRYITSSLRAPLARAFRGFQHLQKDHWRAIDLYDRSL